MAADEAGTSKQRAADAKQSCSSAIHALRSVTVVVFTAAEHARASRHSALLLSALCTWMPCVSELVIVGTGESPALDRVGDRRPVRCPVRAAGTGELRAVAMHQPEATWDVLPALLTASTKSTGEWLYVMRLDSGFVDISRLAAAVAGTSRWARRPNSDGYRGLAKDAASAPLYAGRPPFLSIGDGFLLHSSLLEPASRRSAELVAVTAASSFPEQCLAFGLWNAGVRPRNDTALGSLTVVSAASSGAAGGPLQAVSAALDAGFISRTAASAVRSELKQLRSLSPPVGIRFLVMARENTVRRLVSRIHRARLPASTASVALCYVPVPRRGDHYLVLSLPGSENADPWASQPALLHVRLASVPTPPSQSVGVHASNRSHSWDQWLRFKMRAMIEWSSRPSHVAFASDVNPQPTTIEEESRRSYLLELSADKAARRPAQPSEELLRAQEAARRQLQRAMAAQWTIVADDDTHAVDDGEALGELLQWYDPAQPIAIGRVLTAAPRFTSRQTGGEIPPLRQRLLGGGAGIVLSRGAMGALAAALQKRLCTIRHHSVVKWVQWPYRGGDAWLGQCLELAGVSLVAETCFQPVPPRALPADEAARAVTFHRVPIFSTQALQAPPPTASPLCSPVFYAAKNAFVCAPAFTIIGAPKCASTTLFHWLGQHPAVRLADEKELNFWGSPFRSRSPMNTSATSVVHFEREYLASFPHLAEINGREPLVATGEASPSYLYSTGAPMLMQRFLPRMRLICLLREPIERTVSEYLNKHADGTVEKYLRRRAWTSHAKLWRATEPTLQQLVADVEVARRKCNSRTYYSFVGGTPKSPLSCYVNPFVLNSAYALYLPAWFDAFPEGMLVLAMEELQNEPQPLLRRVVSHLGLMPFEFDTKLVFNTRNHRGVHTWKAGRKTDAIGGYASGTTERPSEMLSQSALSYEERCILARFFLPFTRDLATYLAERRQLSRLPWATSEALHESLRGCSGSKRRARAKPEL